MTSVSNHSSDQTPLVPFSTASQRLASNRAVINAYRKSGSEPVIVPLPADTCDFDRTAPSLADAIGQVRASECLHVCRGCAAPLLPSQTCGSSCRTAEGTRVALVTTASDSIITCLSLYPSLPTATLIAIEEHHGYKRSEILDALEDLILARAVCVTGDSLSLAERVVEEIPPAYLAAADAYRKAKHPTLADRAGVLIANLWSRLWLHVVFTVVVSSFALGLCAPDAVCNSSALKSQSPNTADNDAATNQG